MDFYDCMKAIKRYVWVIIAITILASFSSWAVSKYYLVPKYKSTATILVSGGVSEDYASDRVLLEDNYIKTVYNIALSDTVAQDVINIMRSGWKVKYLKKLMDIDADYETGIVEISAVIHDPELSMTIVQTYIEILENHLYYGVLDVGITIIDAPAMPKHPVSPNITLNVLLSLAGGIMTGILLVLLIGAIEHRKTKITVLDKFPSLFVLGCLPIISNKNSEKTKLFYDGALKVIRTNLEYILERDLIRTLIITSPESAEGKTTIAINTALSLAQHKKQVLLIDCNFDSPGLFKIYNSSKDKAPNDTGGYRRIDKYWIKPIPDLGIDVISDCMGPRNREDFNPAFLQNMLEIMKQYYNLIILDCPPVISGGDTLMIARLVKNAVIISDYRKLSFQILDESLKRLTQINTNILGIIVNRVPLSKI